MRAVVIREPGGPEVLSVEAVPLPEPGAGEVRVRTATSGVNRPDLLQRRGLYPAPPGWPTDIPGLEIAGTVDAVGPEVSRWRPGDAVMGIVGGGGYGEHVLSPADTLVPAPEGMALDDAGALPEAFFTAFDAAFLQSGLADGEVVLIHAVGSGVGTAALQLARAFGVRTIGTSRTATKLQRAEILGLDHPVLPDEGWPQRVLDLTAGRGVDVIVDLVGGPYLAGNQKVIARGGRHIVVGVPGGPRAEIDLRALMGKRASLRGTLLRPRPVEEKAALARAFEERVLPLFASGVIRPVVDRVFRPEEAGDAHRALEANESFGKLLLKW
jgi:putative PIG3 family NAD(P)H quinone oxidoreductase